MHYYVCSNYCMSGVRERWEERLEMRLGACHFWTKSDRHPFPFYSNNTISMEK